MVRARSAKAAENEENIQLALAGLENGTYLTIGQAHRELGVSKCTLRRRRKGSDRHFHLIKFKYSNI